MNWGQEQRNGNEAVPLNFPPSMYCSGNTPGASLPCWTREPCLTWRDLPRHTEHNDRLPPLRQSIYRLLPPHITKRRERWRSSITINVFPLCVPRPHSLLCMDPQAKWRSIVASRHFQPTPYPAAISAFATAKPMEDAAPVRLADVRHIVVSWLRLRRQGHLLGQWSRRLQQR